MHFIRVATLARRDIGRRGPQLQSPQGAGGGGAHGETLNSSLLAVTGAGMRMLWAPHQISTVDTHSHGWEELTPPPAKRYVTHTLLPSTNYANTNGGMPSPLRKTSKECVCTALALTACGSAVAHMDSEYPKRAIRPYQSLHHSERHHAMRDGPMAVPMLCTDSSFSHHLRGTIHSLGCTHQV